MTEPVPTRGPRILGVSMSLIAASGIIVGARIMARRLSTAGNRINSDDWLIVLAWVFALTRSIIDIFSVLIYGLGKHTTDISVGKAHQAGLLVWISALFYRLSALTIKLSILVLYLRLFAPTGLNPRFRRVVIFSIYAVVFVFGTFIILGIFGCWPVDKYWIKGKNGRCINFLPFYYVHTAMEVLFDVWVMLLPVRIIGELALPRKTKCGLVVLFGLGLLSTAANIPLFQSLSEASQRADMSWTTSDAKTWASLELNLSIICTCLPILRNPFRNFARRIFGASIINTDNATIGSQQHHLDPWDEARSYTGTIGSINQIQPSNFDIVAVSDFAGSREKYRVG